MSWLGQSPNLRGQNSARTLKQHPEVTVRTLKRQSEHQKDRRVPFGVPSRVPFRVPGCV